jgi:hypothetical protein
MPLATDDFPNRGERMRKFIIGFTFLLSAQQALAQERTQTPVDSLSVQVLDLGISFGKPTLLLPRSLSEHAEARLLALQPMTLGHPPAFLVFPASQEIDLLSPLKLQQESAEKFQTLYTILGTAQLGVVTYLAYQHIKKYGFK